MSSDLIEYFKAEKRRNRRNFALFVGLAFIIGIIYLIVSAANENYQRRQAQIVREIVDSCYKQWPNEGIGRDDCLEKFGLK